MEWWTSKRPAALRAVALPAVVAALAMSLAACGNDDDDNGSGGGGVANACVLPAGPAGGTGSGTPGSPGAPEIATGFQAKQPVTARTFMAVTANPLATKAACDVLAAGGTAVDAAVAAQMMLGLVEPQSSGIGGGGFLMYYDKASGAVLAYDGRETAPAAATENYLRYVAADPAQPVLPNARVSGRSVGTPGAVRMLELAHQRHGNQRWSNLFQPAIATARDGFQISPRMAESVAGSRAGLARDPDAAAYFLNADGTAKPAGTLLRNPAYADTLAQIAENGANAFYTGPIAQAIVNEIQNPPTSAAVPAVTGGLTTLADMAGYRPVVRQPVCSTYRQYEVCGMPPPSSGGIAVAQTLGILENFDMAQYRPTEIDVNGGKPTALGVHLFAEANRLAYADRNRYVADADFVPLPGGSVDTLINKPYLQQRARLISLDRSIGTAQPGALGPVLASDLSAGGRGTTHLSIVDRYGNAVAFTTTVESGFGNFSFVRGFLLNNQLTDFSPAPTETTGPFAGQLIANRVQPLKRPRSSMAPTLVFTRGADGRRGDLYLATGSPGGATIIQYVAKTLVGNIDWGLDAQQAVSLTNFGSANGPNTNVEGDHPGVTPALLSGLTDRGHTVNRAAQTSGLSSIMRTTVNGELRLVGGADPRRENLALGD